MHPAGQRSCRNCKDFFLPDPRNRHHQRYCGRPACCRESKVASQRKWENRPENRDCYCGSARVTKVRAWRAAHPGYWKRGRKQTSALPDVLIAQVVAERDKAKQDGRIALPDIWQAQTPLLVGLIAQITGFALPEDIVVVANRFVARGQALLGHSHHENRKTHPLAGPTAPLPGAVLLR
jgi:hypothetical protein